MRLIDADTLQKALANMWYESQISITGISVSKLIDEQPTIELNTDGDLISKKEALDAMDTWPKFGVDNTGRICKWTKEFVPYVKFSDMWFAVYKTPSIKSKQDE